jgi:RES domain-containing protein
VKLRAWRIVGGAFADKAFTGEGAATWPGRWNNLGTRLVYAADSPALALLEILANRDSIGTSRAVPVDLVAFSIDFREKYVFEPSALPDDWDARLVQQGTRDLGSQWALEMTSAVMRVPSVCMPLECCYLLNPLHPDFRRLRIGRPRPVPLDPRLLEKGM